MSTQDHPVKLALIGYGKMGKEIERLALERGMQITARVDIESPSLLIDGVKSADVAIHFAIPGTVLSQVEQLADLGKDVVLGTTGWQNDRAKIQAHVERKGIGLVHASNFSLGMNIVYHLLREAGLLFDRFEEYDVSVHEVHHKEKLDSPSGTALTIANILLSGIGRKKEILAGSSDGKIRPEQLQVTSTRTGAVVGIHRVMFDSPADNIEVVHTAKNRTGFALGALLAAEWIRGKKGFFTMDDVLEDIIKQQG
jgi:4-hydroxy-tetrahydrodipicolinate reductase